MKTNVSTLSMLNFIFSKEEKKKALLIVLLLLIVALFDLVGVSSIIPVLSVLADESLVSENEYLEHLFLFFGFADVDNFLIFLGCISFLFILMSSMVRIFSSFIVNRFVNIRRHVLSEKLLGVYLRQDYAFFLERHSGTLAKNVLSEVDQLIGGVLMPTTVLISNLFILLSISLLLFISSPMLATGVGLTLASIYLLIFFSVRLKLLKFGKLRLDANEKRFKVATETFNSIKEIKFWGLESRIVKNFETHSYDFSINHSWAQTITQAPKYIVEGFTVGVVMIVALIVIVIQDGNTSSSLSEFIPILGVFAFGSLKMLPAAQAVYVGFSNVKASYPSLSKVYDDFNLDNLSVSRKTKTSDELHFKSKIQFENVDYRYETSSTKALRNINFEIYKGENIGVVGPTGSGKTTLVDILLGLLKPTAGTIKIDGKEIVAFDKQSKSLSMAYVPQDVVLLDRTVKENIEFFFEGSDNFNVEKCASIAQIHEFITSKLPQQYNTYVGDKGVRLSGGQRQRIGIARALFSNPSLIVFDEATSALDTITESEVLKAMGAVSKHTTCITIAHRLASVRLCDRIIVLSEGEIEDIGTYDDLLERSSVFRDLHLLA